MAQSPLMTHAYRHIDCRYDIHNLVGKMLRLALQVFLRNIDFMHLQLFPETILLRYLEGKIVYW